MVTQTTELLPTQSLRLGPDCTTKPCGSVLLFGSASMSALHTSVDVGVLPNQTVFIHFHAAQCWSISTTLRDQQHDKRSPCTAGLHSIPEQVGPDRDGGSRPDGVTSFPFKGGKALAWDATFTDSLSTSNPHSTILNPGSASCAAEDLMRRKYPQLAAVFEYVPCAC